MIKLTTMQLSLLVAANGRDGGGLTRTANLRPAIAKKIAAKLIEHRLVREIRARADLPVWREDEEGRRFSLAILKAGRAAARAASGGGADASISVERQADVAANQPQQPGSGLVLGKPGSKRALIVGLLQQPDGATIKDLMAATGWLPHTTRAALTGLRKSGLAIDRRQGAEMQGSVYRLATTATSAAA